MNNLPTILDLNPQSYLIEVHVEKYKFTQFESISLTRSLNSLCGQFEITCLPPEDCDHSILLGDALTIKYKENVVFTGIVETISKSIGSQGRQYQISGRDKTSILVDSSVVRSPMGYGNPISITDLANDLCKPFGISVESNLKKEQAHPNWYLVYGESIFEALDRMAKIDGVLLGTNEFGDLLISWPTINPISSRLEIIEGVNLFELSYKNTQKSLYHKYEITTYAQGVGNTIQESKKLTLTDPTIRLNKTLIIDSEGLSETVLENRLKYEMRTRKAKALELSAQVPGWTDSLGNVFALNTSTFVSVPSLFIEGNYLLSGLKFNLDKERGYTTEITLCSQDAFMPDPAAEARLNMLMDLTRKDSKPKEEVLKH